MKLKRKYYSPQLSKPTFIKSIAVLMFIFSFSLQGQTISILAGSGASETGPTDGSFTVNRTPGFFGAMTINYSVGGTATPTTDYSPLLGTVIMPFLANQVTIPLTGIIDDNIMEGDESVIVNIFPGIGYIIDPILFTATVTIADNDVAGVNVTPIVGTTSESGTSADFLFTLTSQPTADVTIPTNGYDITEHTGPTSVVLTSVNWNTGVNLTVTGLNDAIVDGDVTYNLNTGDVTSPDPFYDALVNADVPQLQITNQDDDVAGVIVTPIVGTTSESGTSADFLFTLTSQPTADVTIPTNGYDTTEHTGPTSVVLTSVNWNTGVNLTVTGLNDAIVDGDVTYNLNTGNVTSLDPAYDALVGTDVPQINITNQDDDTFTVTISASDDTATEAGGSNNGEFTVDLGEVNNTGSPVVVNYTIGGTALNTMDYATIGTTFSIATGDQTATMVINPVNDAVVEGLETVILTLASGAGYTIGASDNASVDIVDNDSFSASISATDDTATEAGTTNNGEFTVDLGAENGTGSPIVVNFTRSGTATHVTDYANIGASVSIANGQQTNTIIINPVDDEVVEGDETVILTLASGTGYTVGGSDNDTVDIVDNDSAGFTVSPTTLSTTENDTSETFAVVLTAEPTSNVVISATSEDTTEGTVSSATLTFTPGNYDEAQTVTVTPVDDLVVDGPVTYDVTLSVVDDSSDDNFDPLADQTLAVTNDDDDIASISILDASANENDPSGNLVFNVVLSNEIPGGTTVNYTFNDGSATGGGVDYDSSNGSLEFDGDAGETQEIQVPLTDDAILEETEDFAVILGAPSNGVIIIGSNIATGTINDDDNCAPAPILNSDITTFFCDVIDISLNDYTDTPAPSGTVLTWSTLSDPLNTNAHLSAADVANPPNDGSYFGFFYDVTNDCASGTIEVELTLNPIPVIAETMGDERCGPGEVILMANGAPDVDEPPTFNWYDSPTGNNLVGTGSSITISLTETTTFYVEATANGCVSERQEVVAIIYPLPSAGTPSNALACSIAANGPTIVDLDDLLTGESTGAWSVTNDPSNSISIGIGNIVNFENRADGDYIFTYTTTDATLPFCENVSSDVTITVNDCDVDTDLDGLLDGLEVALGTDPNNVDTDGDGIEDGVEVGDDTANPLDEDEDGIIDALDSNILDSDMDGVVDQLDPANLNPCVPDLNNEFCVATVDLEITKTVSDNFTRPNENISFNITVTNLTDENATTIEVSDLIEETNGFRYISHFIQPQGSGTYDNETGIWDIPVLDGAGVVNLTILVEAIEEGTFTNTATIISSVPGDFNPENDEVTSEEIVVTQRTSNECGFLFNQFSPNGDGTNDFLVINCITEPEYANNTLEIYDRYGNQVFAVSGYDNTWDGTRKSEDLPKGTYFYILNLGDGSDINKGWIQIIR